MSWLGEKQQIMIAGILVLLYGLSFLLVRGVYLGPSNSVLWEDANPLGFWLAFGFMMAAGAYILYCGFTGRKIWNPLGR